MRKSSDSSSPEWASEAKNARLQTLGEALCGYRSVITCGGAIPIDTQPDRGLGIGTNAVSSPPIVVRWSSNGMGSSEEHAIEFPIPAAGGNTPHQNIHLQKLLSHCAPATFGFDGKDVLDESYRKAAKMDNTRFCTNFHPHDYGIVDGIAQALLPGVEAPASEENLSIEHLGVVAELYKLNIYSGPSGKFKAHVDTPRDARQFGSLVVCLPYPHEGGQLVVRNQGLETIYDWSNTGTTEVSWAAFYSDCEHEVFEVKSGHRITLTYNLYISKRIGSVIERSPSIDPAKYLLYHTAKTLLLDPEFMEGGILGFYCRHGYAHTTSSAIRRLPFALKGVDLTVYSIFRALGLHVVARPIMHLPKPEEEDAYEEEEMSEEEEVSEKEDDLGDFVGRDYHELVRSGDVRDLPCTKHVFEEWPCDRIQGTVWVNQPLSPEQAWLRPTYGNEFSIEWFYSSAAILVKFPGFATRTKTMTQNNENRNEGEKVGQEETQDKNGGKKSG